MSHLLRQSENILSLGKNIFFYSVHVEVGRNLRDDDEQCGAVIASEELTSIFEGTNGAILSIVSTSKLLVT